MILLFSNPMNNSGSITVMLPFILSTVFTVVDIFLFRLVSGSFFINPVLTIISFLELYLLSAVTSLFIKKEIDSKI